MKKRMWLLPRALGVRTSILVAVAAALTSAPGSRLAGQSVLVPMDRSQANHLKAYGLTYSVLDLGGRAEWLLNYRGGSFFLPDTDATRRRAALMGVTLQDIGPAEEARIRGTIESSNMEAVVLEKATKIAIYTPPNSTPWDDAVTMALEYAEIPYEKIWDADVVEGGLEDYEWLHLHHEDFTGQYSKFYITYAGAPWLEDEVNRNEEVARQLQFANVPDMKKAVSRQIRDYVEAGGFLFAMCSAPETLELALAAGTVDVAAAYSDGSPPDPDASGKMDWSQAMAFQGAEVQVAPSVNAFSDIDGH
ncbi:MAG: asparagine synthetase B, partial [Longimicrobiales bacterium]